MLINVKDERYAGNSSRSAERSRLLITASARPLPRKRQPRQQGRFFSQAKDRYRFRPAAARGGDQDWQWPIAIVHSQPWLRVVRPRYRIQGPSSPGPPLYLL